MTYHDASAMISYAGWLKHCDSYNIRKMYIEPYVDLKKCKGVVKNESKKQHNANE